jgi:hypothetical protein
MGRCPHLEDVVGEGTPGKDGSCGASELERERAEFGAFFGMSRTKRARDRAPENASVTRATRSRFLRRSGAGDREIEGVSEDRARVRERSSVVSSEAVRGLEGLGERFGERFDSARRIIEDLFGGSREPDGGVRGRSSGIGRERRAGRTALRGREAARRADDGPGGSAGGRSR